MSRQTFSIKGFNAMFTMSKREESNGRWWLGEPIWITAEKQGAESAPYSAGSEAENRDTRRPIESL